LIRHGEPVEPSLPGSPALWVGSFNCVLADFFCVSKGYCDEVCRPPFIGLSEHREYSVPMLFQPIEVRERKSMNMVLDCDSEFKKVSFEEFYATKGDGDQDQSINEDYRTASL
jgi:hypothetical protein